MCVNVKNYALAPLSDSDREVGKIPFWSRVRHPLSIGPVDFWSRILPVKLSFTSIIQARGFIIASSGPGRNGWEALDTFFPPVEANTGAHIDIFLGMMSKS